MLNKWECLSSYRTDWFYQMTTHWTRKYSSMSWELLKSYGPSCRYYSKVHTLQVSYVWRFLKKNKLKCLRREIKGEGAYFLKSYQILTSKDINNFFNVHGKNKFLRKMHTFSIFYQSLTPKNIRNFFNVHIKEKHIRNIRIFTNDIIKF